MHIFPCKIDFLCVFLQSRFIVQDVSGGERKVEIECGGGHRSWDFIRASGSLFERYRFGFIKAKRIVAATGRQPAENQILKV